MFRESHFSVSRSVSTCVSLAGFLYSRPSPFAVSLDHDFSCAVPYFLVSPALPFENSFLGTEAGLVGLRSRLSSSCGWLVSLTGLLLRLCLSPMSQFVRGIGSAFGILNFENFETALFCHTQDRIGVLGDSQSETFFFVNCKWRASWPIRARGASLLFWSRAAASFDSWFGSHFVHFLSCSLLCCAQSSLHHLVLGFKWCQKKRERVRE